MEVIGIVVKWREIAEKSLDSGEEIEKSFRGKLDGEYGYLLISNKRLLFVHEEGFWNKKYDITLNIPLEDVGKISHEDRRGFALIETDGKKHVMKTIEIPSSIIERSLEEIMKKSES